MLTIIKKNLPLLFLLFLLGCGSKNYFRYQETTYLLGGAHEAFLGSIGTFEDEYFKAAFSPDWSIVPLVHTTRFVNLSGDFRINFTLKQGTYSIEDNVNVGEIGKSNESENEDENESSKYRTFHIIRIADIGDLIDNLNSSQNQQRLIGISHSTDVRIIVSFVIFTNEETSTLLTEKEEVRLSLVSGAKNSRGARLIRVEARDEKPLYITMSDVNVYAYEMGSFCWKKNTPQPKIAIINIDKEGQKKDCPSSTTESFLRETIENE